MSDRRAIRFDDRVMSVYQWMDALADAQGTYIDQVSITRGAMARRYNLSRHHATRLLRRMVAEGVLIEDFEPARRPNQYVYWLAIEMCELLAPPHKISWIGG